MYDLNLFDAIIVGGGPAGCSCALWLKLLGYQPCIIERRSKLGGLQNDSPFSNSWIATSPTQTGHEVAACIHQHIIQQQIACVLNNPAISITQSAEDRFSVLLANQESIHAQFLVIASGSVPVDGGLRASDRILIGPGEHIVHYDFAHKRVAILGGGDNAFENYEFIKNKGAADVHIYAHSIVARKQFVKGVPQQDIFCGKYGVDAENCKVANKFYDVIAVFYGWKPKISYLNNLSLMQQEGFISTDFSTAETSIPGIYAIGEVTSRFPPNCVTAMADGVVAAVAIQKKMENLLKAKDTS